MKNICFTISDISTCGGTERVCLRLANALTDKGYHIHILSGETSNHPFFPCNSKIKLSRMLSNRFERKLRYKKWYRRWKCRRYFIKNKIDVVIDVDVAMSRFTIPAVSGLDIKVISWEQYSVKNSMDSIIWKDAIAYIIEGADAVVTLTKGDMFTYTQAGYKPKRILNIYNPLSFDLMPYEVRTSHKVISMGRISPEKGFDLLLQAWKIVEQYIDNWELEIVCATGDYEQLQRDADTLGLKRVLCSPPTKDVAGKLKSSGIYACSSRSEGFGLVLTEAASVGLPLLSFDCPIGPREIITNGKNGYLIPYLDVEDFAHQLCNLIQDEDKRFRMGKNAYESCLKFSLNTITNQWINLLESL